MHRENAGIISIMQRIPVDSTDIVAIGYDPKGRVLEIEFKENRVYQYQGVEPDVYERFMRADSFGQYFFAAINGRYRYQRIDAAEKSAPTQPQALAFVTANARKWRDMQAACAEYALDIERLELPIDEIQSHDPQEVALKKARHAHKLAGRPVVVQDTFWNIIALRGFPGAYMSYVADWFRPEDFLKLMEGKNDRTIGCTDTLVYYDGMRSKVFSQDLWGTITDKPRGAGRSIEQIIIISGESKTVAEIETEENRSCIDPDDSIWSDFAKWYHLQRRIGRV